MIVTVIFSFYYFSGDVDLAENAVVGGKIASTAASVAQHRVGGGGDV